MQISKQDEWLTVNFQKSEAFYAVRSRLTIKKKDIESISWEAEFQDWPSWHLRLPGTYLPGFLMAGSYYSPVGWDFIYASNPKGWTRTRLNRVMVIRTKKNRFKRVILSCSQETAKELIQWLEN